MEDLKKLMHIAAITDLLNRYFVALDERQFEPAAMRQIFSEGALVQRPNRTTMCGPAAIGQSHSQSFRRFRATQHLPSGHMITLTSDATAQFRVNVVAIHLWAAGAGDPSANPDDNYFLAGAVLTGDAALGEDGWRIVQQRSRAVWRQGTGFQQMLATQ